MRDGLQIRTCVGSEVFDIVEVDYLLTRRGQYNAQIKFFIQRALDEANGKGGHVELKLISADLHCIRLPK